MLSSCHQAPVTVGYEDEGAIRTYKVFCTECDKPCEITHSCKYCQFESGHSRSCPQFVEGKLTIHPPCVKCDKPIKVGWCTGCHKRSNDKMLEEMKRKFVEELARLPAKCGEEHNFGQDCEELDKSIENLIKKYQ